jgi:hypothetical protein
MRRLLPQVTKKTKIPPMKGDRSRNREDNTQAQAGGKEKHSGAYTINLFIVVMRAFV